MRLELDGAVLGGVLREHPAASNRRTLGDQPVATMSARVTLTVNRCAA